MKISIEVLVVYFRLLLFIGICSFVIWPILYLIFGRSKKITNTSYDKLVSIVIPAFNEEKVIKYTIDSIEANNYPNKEIIVVNDGSNDNTKQVALKSAKTTSIRVIDTNRCGRANAVNEGIKAARGELILVTDADTYVAENWVKKMTEPFVDPKIGAVGGPIYSHDPETFMQKWQQAYNLVILDFLKRSMDSVNGMMFISGASGCFRKEAIEKIGYFDTRLRTLATMDLTIRIRKAGYKVKYVTDTSVKTFEPKKAKTFFKRHDRWFGGLSKITKKHTRTIFNPKAGSIGMFTLPLSLFQSVGLSFIALIYVLLIFINFGMTLSFGFLFSELIWIGIDILVFTLIFAAMTIGAYKINEIPLSGQTKLITFLWAPLSIYTAIKIITKAFSKKKDKKTTYKTYRDSLSIE